MKTNRLSILGLALSLQVASADKEFATLQYGDHLDIPEGKVATFLNAQFNTSLWIGEVYSEIVLYGVTTNEELVLLQYTPINTLMPTFEVGDNGPGSPGAPEHGSKFMMQGPIRFKLAMYQGGVIPIFNAPEITAKALVCIEDANPVCCPTPATTGVIPQAAVVIPSDSKGPVDITLESSVDMINWVSATPGTYGSSETNRFFRVKATNNNP